MWLKASGTNCSRSSPSAMWTWLPGLLVKAGSGSVSPESIHFIRFIQHLGEVWAAGPGLLWVAKGWVADAQGQRLYLTHLLSTVMSTVLGINWVPRQTEWGTINMGPSTSHSPLLLLSPRVLCSSTTVSPVAHSVFLRGHVVSLWKIYQWNCPR